MGVTLLSIVDDTFAEAAGGEVGLTHYNYKFGSKMIPVLKEKMGDKIVVFGGMRYAPL